jgi:mono/diheme cytochrome c family protein
MSRTTSLVIALVAFLVAGVALGLVARSLTEGPERLARDLPAGERIFRYGLDADGNPIPRSGGMMMRTGCAGCHGRDGRGRSTAMFVSPDISYENLTDPAGMREPDGSRGDTFTDALIMRAVTEGLDAEGEPLSWPMPQWRLTDGQWASLLDYLKTLP